MHELNLLPPFRRTLLVREKNLHFTRTFLWWCSGGLFIITVAGVIAGVSLRFTLRAKGLEANSARVQVEYNDLRAQILDWNQRFEFIEERTRQRVVWSTLIDSLLSTVSDGIVIQRFEGGVTDGVITLAGQAPLRRDVVDFEQQLRQLPWVHNLEAPHSNLLLPANPSYQFTLSLPGASAAPTQASPTP